MGYCGNSREGLRLIVVVPAIRNWRIAFSDFTGVVPNINLLFGQSYIVNRCYVVGTWPLGAHISAADATGLEHFSVSHEDLTSRMLLDVEGSQLRPSLLEIKILITPKSLLSFW